VTTEELEGGLSLAGARFIARFEGFRGHLYNDPAGHCTIGYGHLVHLGPCNGTEPPGWKDGITQQEALDLLRRDAGSPAAAINRSVRVPLNQSQFDALTSFTYNVGNGAFAGSTLLRKLNIGDYGSVPSELMRWVKAGGKTLPGLVARRRAEGDLFAHRRYTVGVEAEQPDADLGDQPAEEEHMDDESSAPVDVPTGEDGPADEGQHQAAGADAQDVGEPTDKSDTADDVLTVDQRIVSAMRVALNMGLRISSTNTGTHAPDSYHKRPPCGPVVVNGKRYSVCRAFDAADAANSDALYRRFFHALESTRPTELFYDPMGYSWKNGQKVNWVVGGHRDHVHVAY
jgi:lysozyme